MGLKTFCLAFLLTAAAAMLPVEAYAQTYTESTLYSFCSQAKCADGGGPYGGIVQGRDGNFYGVAVGGGANNWGTVFKMTPSGVLTTLYSFCSQGGENCTDGATPVAIMQASDGNFYGATLYGGANAGTGSEDIGGGTVFKITPSGSETVLYSFCSQGGSSCTDGDTPYGGITQGSDGNFYGTTKYGGSVCEPDDTAGCGTVFKLTPSGTLTTLHVFAGNDGIYPNGLLVQGTDGNFYGTTSQGGLGGDCFDSLENGCGAVFKMTPSGTLTALYSFCVSSNCEPGATPNGGLVEGSDGNFYGTTPNGGSSVVDPINSCEGGCGTAFKITSAGTYTAIYNFCAAEGSCADAYPETALLLGSDGNFYGATQATVFILNPAGTLTTLYTFCAQTNCADGLDPNAPLQASDGNFYGTANEGGITNTECSEGCGTAFKLAVTPTLAAPVQVTLSSNSASVGENVTLTWKVLNGFSLTLQQCYAFLTGGSGGGEWTGLQPGSIVDGVYTGSTTITPTAIGTYNYALTCGGTESASAGLNVGAKSATSVDLTSNSPVTLGSVVNLTATPTAAEYVAPYTGSVAFSYGATSLGTVILNVNGMASLDLTAAGIPTGTYPIKAAYSGDGNYQPSSATTNVVVLGYATTMALNATPASVTQGQSVKLSATVSRTSVSGTPTGSVTFYYGSAVLGKANLSNGKASLTAATSSSIPPGTYAITAKYSGDSSDQASTSSVEDVAVIAVTSTTLTVSPNPAPADSPVTITATVKETYDSGIPTGTVAFSFGSDSLGSVNLTSGTATVNASDYGIAPGTYAVTATYTGDANNAASTKTVNLVIQ